MPARKIAGQSSDRLTITLESNDRVALEARAKEIDRSIAWILRDAVKQYLAKLRPERDKG